MIWAVVHAAASGLSAAMFVHDGHPAILGFAVFSGLMAIVTPAVLS